MAAVAMSSLQLASSSSTTIGSAIALRVSSTPQGGFLVPFQPHPGAAHLNALRVKNGELTSSAREYRMDVLIASSKNFVPVRAWITAETGVPTGSERSRDVACRALPTAATAVLTVGIVGAAAFALVKLQREKPEVALANKKDCQSCEGSGLCPSCKGEGFLLKSLTPEAAARARARAEDVATRYTAGLAKKWSYCPACSGSRSCLTCQGKGFLQES